MDLQSARSNVSPLYYKMKMTIHNCTIFNLNTKDGFCFIWNELEGDITSNEFSYLTIIPHFLLSQLPLAQVTKKIVGYCTADVCAYQNSSNQLATVLLHVFSTKNVIIEKKFLVVGHTQMEADSMHSLIERRLKSAKINVPADYISVCEEARKSPAPYMTYLEHTFFKNFEHNLFYKSIRPDNCIGSPRVLDIRALKYLCDCTIKYKLHFSDGWEILPQ